jgi:hypothetical protein
MRRMMAWGLTLMGLSLAACQGATSGVPTAASFTAQDLSIGGYSIPDGSDTSLYTQGAAQGAAAGLNGANQGIQGANLGAASGMAGADMAMLGANMGMSMGGSMGGLSGLTTMGANMGPALAMGMVGGGLGTQLSGPTMGGLMPTAGGYGLGSFGGIPGL